MVCTSFAEQSLLVRCLIQPWGGGRRRIADHYLSEDHIMSKPSISQRPCKEERSFFKQHEKAQKLAKRREARDTKPEQAGQGERQTEPRQ